MTAAAGAYNESDLALDSTFFVAFDLTHRALKGGLAAASPLNVTQYRMLVKLLAAGPDGVAQSDLGRLLDLKPNVVTQALNALEEAGFAERLRGEGADGRTRTARATGAGEEHVARANASIVERLYALFPTEDADHRAILEASIAAGASIDPPLSGDVASRFVASRALVSLELVKRAMEGALRRAAGAPGWPSLPTAARRGRGPRRGRPGRARVGAAPRQPERPQGRVRGSHRRGRAQAEGHRLHRRRPRAHAAVGAPRRRPAPRPRPHLARRHRRRPGAQGA